MKIDLKKELKVLDIDDGILIFTLATFGVGHLVFNQ